MVLEGHVLETSGQNLYFICDFLLGCDIGTYTNYSGGANEISWSITPSPQYTTTRYARTSDACAEKLIDRCLNFSGMVCHGRESNLEGGGINEPSVKESV